MHDQPVERVMARFIEHIAEFFDLAAHQRLQRSRDAADGAHRIGNVAEHELPRIVARVHVAIQFLGIAGAGEQRRPWAAPDAGPDEQKL